MSRHATGFEGLETHVYLQDGALITGTVQDCTPILEDAKARQAAGFTGTSEMKHAARLPLQAIEAYCNDAGITLDAWFADPVHCRRMLADPALADFRIWRGRL